MTSAGCSFSSASCFAGFLTRAVFPFSVGNCVMFFSLFCFYLIIVTYLIFLSNTDMLSSAIRIRNHQTVPTSFNKILIQIIIQNNDHTVFTSSVVLICFPWNGFHSLDLQHTYRTGRYVMQLLACWLRCGAWEDAWEI